MCFQHQAAGISVRPGIRKRVQAAAMALLAIVGLAQFAAADEEPDRNLAIEKPYFMLPAPSYWGCVDAGDATQLTDGQPSSGFWLDKACVGWSEGSRKVAVLIDLENAQAFDTVEVTTIRGEFAGALPPLSLDVYVSDDGDRFNHLAGQRIGGYDIASRKTTEREPGKFTEHLTLKISDFSAEGRFVLVAMDRGDFLFLDEVSVFRRGDAPPSDGDGKQLSNKEVTAQYLGVPKIFDPQIEPFVTPHWPTAKGLAGGPIDAMLVIPVATSRDAEELGQRLDLGMRVIATDEGPEVPMNGLFQVRIARDIALQTPEALVMCGTRWQGLAPQLRQAIVQRVQAGMGLVMVDPQLNLKELRGLGLPLVASGESSALHLRVENNTIQMQCGEGRVVLVDDKGLSNYASHTMVPPPVSPMGSLATARPLDHEYAYSRVARAIHWAARAQGNPQARGVKSVGFDAPQLSVAVFEPGRVRIEIRDVFDQLQHRQELDTGSASAAVFKLPTLPGVELHALVQKLDESGHVEDWHALKLEQTPLVSIASMQGPHSVSGRRDEITLNIHVDETSLQPEDRLLVRLVDTLGRVVHEREHDWPANPGVAVKLNHTELLTRAVSLQAAVMRKGQLLDERRQWVLVREPANTKEDFRLDLWTGSNAMSMRHYADGIYEQSRRLGTDGIFSTWPMVELCSLAATHDIANIPENILRIYEEPGSTPTVRIPSLDTPDFRARLEESIGRAIATYGPYGMDLASLGDECAYASSADSDRSPEALELFQAWLVSRYENIDALNQACGLQLASFAQAVPPLTADATQSGEFGLWLAHREFSVYQFSKTLSDATDIFRKAYPDTPFGVSGSQLPNAANGHDYAQLTQSLDAISAYGAMQRELLRSLAVGEHTHTVWSGFDYTGNNERMEKYNILQSLMQGFKGVALFNQFEQRSHALNSSGYIGPDLRPHRRAIWARDTVADIRQAGLSLLVEEAQPNDQGVGVLYSTRSLMMGTVAPVHAEGYLDGTVLYLDAVVGVVEALKDLQRPFVFIDESRLGQLDPAQTSLLLVPAAMSLSDESLAHLSAYTRGGGAIVCGMNTARFDAHGKARSPEQVRDALGFMPSFADTLAPSLLDQPQVVSLGKGAAVNLGGSLFDYAPTRVGGAGGELIDQGGSSARKAELRQALEKVITPYAPQRAVEARDEQGRLSPAIEVFPMNAQQGYRFAGVLGAYSQPGMILPEDRHQLSIGFQESGVVYELLTGESLGQTDVVEVALAQGEARFFALLPHKVADLGLSAEHVDGRVSLEAGIVLEGGHMPGPHAIRIEVTDPTGRIRPEYGGVLPCEQGRIAHGFELALNDPEGEWIVTAHDTISRIKKQVVVIAGHPN